MRAGTQAATDATATPMSTTGTRSVTPTTGAPTLRLAMEVSSSSGSERVTTMLASTPKSDPINPVIDPWATRLQVMARGGAPHDDSRPIVRSWRRAPTAKAAAMTVLSTINAIPPAR